MALNEDALESLLQGGERRHSTAVKVAEQTDEFEVYERATPRDIMTDTTGAAAQAPAEPMAEPMPEALVQGAAPAVQEPPVAPVQEAAPAVQDTAPEVGTAPIHRPAAPALKFPGTTDRPPQLGIQTGTPPVPEPATAVPGPEPAPEPTNPQPPASDPTPSATSTTTGGDVSVAIVQADFNPAITDEMARLATERARALGATVVQHVHVAGAFDLPLTAQTLARRDGIDAVVAIGCVIQGETGHDLTITDAAAGELARIACDEETPVGFGVIGPRMTREQAEARVQVGANAMESAIRQVRTLRAIADPSQVDTTQYVAQGH